MIETADDKTTILTSEGERIIVATAFPALEGFELDRRYRVDYKVQADRDIRREYTLAVLRHAWYDGKALDNVEFINDTLENWKNVEQVFHHVLEFNNVDLELAEERARWFEFAGAELAATFIATTTRLMGPILEANAASQEEPNGG